MQSEYVSIQEVADFFSIPVSWVYSRTRQRGAGRIPYLKVGKYCRFRLSEVEEWLKRQQQEQ